jgi:hypothetical protein
MKYAVQMGSDAMMYIPSLIMISSGIQELIGGSHRHTESKVTSYACFHFFRTKKTG